MVTDLLSKWLAYYDPIHRGWTPKGIANGVSATRGFSFPRVAGGYNLYRGAPGADDIDFSAPVGASGAAAREIKTFSWRVHAPSTTYAYALRSVGGGGVESAASVAVGPVPFDVAGEPIGLIPNSVVNLATRSVSGGALEISFDYDPRGQEIAPIEFRIFGDDGSGSVDFGSPVGLVTYRARGRRYRFVTAPIAHGAVRSFAVRAVAADGTDDGSTETVAGVGDAVSPPVHPGIFTETVEAKS